MLTAYETKQLSDVRAAIREGFLTRLYGEQLKYWNSRLIRLASRNAIVHGRRESNLQTFILGYDLFHNGQIWLPETLNLPNIREKRACLPVHPDFPQLEVEADIVTAELEELIDEKYETNRFILGLITFPMTADTFQEIVGDILYSACELVIRRYERLVRLQICGASNTALNTFVTEHAYIRDVLKQRLLINLITLDATKQA